MTKCIEIAYLDVEGGHIRVNVEFIAPRGAGDGCGMELDLVSERLIWFKGIGKDAVFEEDKIASSEA